MYPALGKSVPMQTTSKMVLGVQMIAGGGGEENATRKLRLVLPNRNHGNLLKTKIF